MTMDELGRLASAEQMIPHAPILAKRSVEITAPVEKVWSILTGVPRWEQWYPYLKNAKLNGPFEAGVELTYGGLFKHDLRIAKVVQPKLVMVYGTLVGYTAITRWDLETLSEKRTRMSFTESSDGFLIATLSSNKSLETHLRSGSTGSSWKRNAPE